LLPSGQSIGKTDSDFLRREFTRLAIPGFVPTMGRLAAVELYAKHLGAIGKAGFDGAVAYWLSKHRS
jgi:hypothetical protein